MPSQDLLGILENFNIHIANLELYSNVKAIAEYPGTFGTLIELDSGRNFLFIPTPIELLEEMPRAFIVELKPELADPAHEQQCCEGEVGRNENSEFGECVYAFVFKCGTTMPTCSRHCSACAVGNPKFATEQCKNGEFFNDKSPLDYDTLVSF
jgi:hypothetical protein